MGRPLTNPEDRFLNLVHETPDGCWNWLGAVHPKSGHARFRLPNKTVYAYRWFWEHIIGPIPVDKQICHTCDNPKCVRLMHMYLGTPKSNSDDKFDRNRQRFLQGDEHPSTKVQETEVETIRRLYKEKVPVKTIAQQFGVHIMTIYRKL
jgi:hypothetical protein